MAETWEQLLANLSDQSERDIADTQREVDDDLDAAYKAAVEKMKAAGSEFYYDQAPLLQQIMRVSIVDSGVERIRLLMERMTDNEEAAIGAFLGTGLSPERERALEIAKEANTAWVGDLSASLQPTIRRVMAQAVETPVSVMQVADAIRADLEGPVRAAARALAETHLKVLDRMVINDYGEQQGFNWFIYLGPDDSQVRVFCQHCLRWAFRASDIARMDNGMIPNVLLSCGGWGCRHNWRPISVLVLNELYKGRQVLTARELVLLIGKTREITVLEPLKVA